MDISSSSLTTTTSPIAKVTRFHNIIAFHRSCPDIYGKTRLTAFPFLCLYPSLHLFILASITYCPSPIDPIQHVTNHRTDTHSPEHHVGNIHQDVLLRRHLFCRLQPRAVPGPQLLSRPSPRTPTNQQRGGARKPYPTLRRRHPGMQAICPFR